jgi:mRNA-degrading endonuclease RelE of RelBE toxin-antitoxin system
MNNKTSKQTDFTKWLREIQRQAYVKECFHKDSNCSSKIIFDNAYRIRIGDYRLGIIFDGETLIFERVLHRKGIYRYFPK